MKKYDKFGSLRLAIRDMLRSPDKSGTRRNQLVGRLDRRALIGMATDRQDVMMKKWFEPGRNTVVHIAVDLSGSMGSYSHHSGTTKAQQAADFCKLFADTIAQAGCKCTISGFSTGIYRIVGRNDRLKSETARGNIAVMGVRSLSSTNTMAGLIDGYEQLKDVQHANRLLIVITDGSDDSGEQRVKETCRLITERGVTVLGIGIGGMSVTGQYPYAVNIPGNADMIEGALKEINKTLRSIGK